MTDFDAVCERLAAAQREMCELAEAIRGIDKIMPMGARRFNGLVDELAIDLAKVNEARGRLMQRSGAGQQGVPVGPDGLLPDGSRPPGAQPMGLMR